jgi:hypothetical protein
MLALISAGNQATAIHWIELRHRMPVVHASAVELLRVTVRVERDMVGSVAVLVSS